MKTLKTLLALSFVAAIGLTGCPKDDQKTDDAPATEEKVEEVKAEEKPAEAAAAEAEPDYKAEAEKEITAENADAVADELAKETDIS